MFGFGARFGTCFVTFLERPKFVTHSNPVIDIVPAALAWREVYHVFSGSSRVRSEVCHVVSQLTSALEVCHVLGEVSITLQPKAEFA